MATCSFGHYFPVSCSLERPLDVPGKATRSSSVKPFVKDLKRLTTSMDVLGTIKETSVKMLSAVVDSAFMFVDIPFLPSQSNFAPVEEIGEAVAVNNVEGSIPDGFPEGVYVRNGSNPLFGGLKSTKSVLGKSSHAWVEGEGMLHALYFKKDKNNNWIISYLNRHVQSDTFKLEKNRKTPAFLPALEGDSPVILAAFLLNWLRFGIVDKYMSNTNVFTHAGKAYAIAENTLPQEIDLITLETLETWDCNGGWSRPFTSHPKKVPGTEELVTMGFQPKKPFFEFGVISADGKKVVHKADLEFNRCTFCHEMGITERYNVILDFPLTLDINRLIKGGPLAKYDPSAFARIGVMPHYGDANSVCWFEVKPTCAYHILNCFEDGDEVVVMACTARAAIFPGPDFGINKFEWFSRGFKHINSSAKIDEDFEEGYLFARVHEWRLNMKTGYVKTRYLTGLEFSMDFPMINEKYSGICNKHGYTQLLDLDSSSIAGIAKYGGLAKLYFENKISEEQIKAEYHIFPKNTFCSGSTFIAKPGSLEEDDGWIVTYVHNEDTDISKVYVIDAKNFTGKPVAIINLATRVPYGFHGTFVETI